ncbi:type VII secretion target (plasmid) [Streptomyces rimosus]|uniref:type VII secretion target n=1 Tax=Streptomyces rimosus TaxID=1927 RepID=UPI0031D6DA0D
MGNISINSHAVRATGSDMSALSREVARKLNNSLEESQATGVADSVWGWECAQHLYSCAQTWEEHMVGLAKKMGELGERLQESAGSYDAQDEEAASRLRHGLNDLGKA